MNAAPRSGLGRDAMLVAPCDRRPARVQPRAHGTLEDGRTHVAAPESRRPHRRVRQKRAAGAGRRLLGESGSTTVARGPEGDRPVWLSTEARRAVAPRRMDARPFHHGARAAGWGKSAVCVFDWGGPWRDSSLGRGSGSRRGRRPDARRRGSRGGRRFGCTPSLGVNARDSSGPLLILLV